MLVPLVATRMEQTLHFTGGRIDGSQIGPFVLVAKCATQRQIFGIGLATMLRGDDMVNLVGDERQSLRYQAVLASALGSGADFRAEGGSDIRH